MSLDGFIAGPNDAMEWVFRYDSPPEVEDVIRSTGAILAGRRSYDVGREPDQHPAATEAFGGAWSGPEFVLTHNPPDDDPKITFLSGDIKAAVDTALKAAGDKNLILLGANVAQQCIDAGLVDEVLIYLLPVLLGDGVRLFHRPGRQIDLEPVDTNQSGQTTILHFKVKK